MTIITTRHANERMRERQISFQHVKFAIRCGTRIEDEKAARYCLGPQHLAGNNRRAPRCSNGVVVVVAKDRHIVITVYRDFNWKKYLSRPTSTHAA